MNGNEGFRHGFTMVLPWFYHVLHQFQAAFECPVKEMRQHCSKSSERRVAVLCCGPSMIQAARRACVTHSQGVTFDFHCETFEF